MSTSPEKAARSTSRLFSDVVSDTVSPPVPADLAAPMSVDAPPRHPENCPIGLGPPALRTARWGRTRLDGAPLPHVPGAGDEVVGDGGAQLMLGRGQRPRLPGPHPAGPAGRGVVEDHPVSRRRR